MKNIDKLLIGIVLVIFGGVVLHAPLSVGFGVMFPELTLVIKAWKEILMLVASGILLLVLARQKAWAIYKSWLFWVIAVYSLLHLALIPVFYQGLQPTLAGLMIDLRYLLFFVLVYGVVGLYPRSKKLFLKVFIAGVIIVVGFATLQLTVLPYDFLKYLGYSQSTITPYLTVDQNMDYIRIISTLRGPNPLGAYAVIALSVLAVYSWVNRAKLSVKKWWMVGALALLSAVTLWFTYSRSAKLAAVVALGVIFIVLVARRLPRKLLAALGVVALLSVGGLYMARDSHFVSNVILHEDPTEGNDVNSNEGHWESLVDGTDRMMRQPWGAGVGSTGSASLMGDKPLIIENQYLFVAHEVGWLGLGLFLAIFIGVLRRLWLIWRKNADWLALAVLSSGLGLALIGVLLPVWVDDTVSIVWWGLTAVAIASTLATGAPKILKKKGLSK